MNTLVEMASGDRRGRKSAAAEPGAFSLSHSPPPFLPAFSTLFPRSLWHALWLLAMTAVAQTREAPARSNGILPNLPCWKSRLASRSCS